MRAIFSASKNLFKSVEKPKFLMEKSEESETRGLLL